MKSKKALLLDELSQLDIDRMAVHQALKEHWTQRFSITLDNTHWLDPIQKAAYDAEVDSQRDAYMDMLEMVNDFRARLCKLLGITDQPVGTYDSAELLDYVDTTEAILGGDPGVSVHINYGRSNKYGDHDYNTEPGPNYKVRMGIDGVNIEAEAANTKDLLTIIDRGYTCLRIMSRGTRYYHSNN